MFWQGGAPSHSTALRAAFAQGVSSHVAVPDTPQSVTPATPGTTRGPPTGPEAIGSKRTHAYVPLCVSIIRMTNLPRSATARIGAKSASSFPQYITSGAAFDATFVRLAGR